MARRMQAILSGGLGYNSALQRRKIYRRMSRQRSRADVPKF